METMKGMLSEDLTQLWLNLMVKLPLIFLWHSPTKFSLIMLATNPIFNTYNLLFKFGRDPEMGREKIRMHFVIKPGLCQNLTSWVFYQHRPAWLNYPICSSQHNKSCVFGRFECLCKHTKNK